MTWFPKVQIEDASGNAADVLPASTPAVASNKALVVSISPNNSPAIVQNVTPSVLNTTMNTPMLAGASFIGLAESSLGVAGLQINVFSDVPSAYEGVQVQQSMDGILWPEGMTSFFTMKGGEGLSTTVQATGSFFRVVYVNGSQNQLDFQLQSALCPVVEAVPREVAANGAMRTVRLPNEYYLFSNATITADGEVTFEDIGERTVALIINIKNSPIGIAPTIQFHMAGLDPGDETTSIANVWDSDVFTNSGVQIVTFPSIYSATFKVWWTLTGTGPIWTGVYLTAVEKATAVRGVTRSPAISPVAQNVASVQLLPVDFNRGSGMICNASQATLYIKFSSAASVADHSLMLFPQDCYEFQPGEFRSIYGIWAAAGAGAAMITVGY